MKKISAILGATIACLLLAASCNDRLSPVGGGVLPSSDGLQPRVDSFQLEAKTIKIDSIYDRSTYSLLGQFTDPLYGNYKASYISRLQHAPGFKFKRKPHEGKIDSTFIRVNYSSWVGDSTIWSKVTAFQVVQPLPESRYSTDLTPYLKEAKPLGSLTYTAGNKTGNHVLLIPIDNAIGEKVYKASLEHPEYFESREAFESNIMRGVFVESTTGSGCMLNVYSTGLAITYKYETQGKTADGSADSTVLKDEFELFVNTKQLYLHRNFEISNTAELLKPNEKYAYITSPQGLALSLTLPAKEIREALLDQEETKKNLERLINGAALELLVDIPPSTSTILQPPPYLLLLPKDSVGVFFEKGDTEVTQPETAFLSSIYSISERRYLFENISLLLNEHLKKNTVRKEDGSLMLEQDLELMILPVTRETIGTANTGKVTANLTNFIFPSAARIKLEGGRIKLKMISTAYERRK